MKIFSANLENLRELYTNSLQKALSMEEQITKALPTMIEKATDAQLKQAFQSHLQETESQVTRLQQLLSEVTDDTSTITCKPLAALVTEAEDMIKDASDESIRDIALIAAAQQVEHHEIAVYGTLRNWAELLALGNQADVLEAILEEEKHADALLTTISDRVNTEAPVTA